MTTEDQFLWLSDGVTNRMMKYDLNGKLPVFVGHAGAPSRARSGACTSSPWIPTGICTQPKPMAGARRVPAEARCRSGEGYRQPDCADVQIDAMTVEARRLTDGAVIAGLMAASAALSLATIANRPETTNTAFLFQDQGLNLVVADTLLSGGCLYRDVAFLYGPIPGIPSTPASRRCSATRRSHTSGCWCLSVVWTSAWPMHC